MDGWKRWGGAGGGGGGRREERRYGDLVVRHKVLGVGPEHGFVLRDAETEDRERRWGEREETEKRKSQLEQQQQSSASTGHR